MFYCQRLCGIVDFSIEEWNKAQEEIKTLTPEQQEFVLEAQPNCKVQCSDCSAIVAKRQLETKNLSVSAPRKPNKIMDFGKAIEALKQGKKVSREGWNGKGMWLALQTVDENSKMGHNYVYMSDVSGKLFPWNPNNLDLLAEDWGLVS